MNLPKNCTPGPWKAHESGRSVHEAIPRTERGRRVIVGSFGVAIDDESQEATAANMKLIASAPDMYDILSKIIHAYYRDGDLDEHIEEATAILAEARGE